MKKFKKRKLMFEELVDELCICRYCAGDLLFGQSHTYVTRSGKLKKGSC
jgi:hypothetical protein